MTCSSWGKICGGWAGNKGTGKTIQKSFSGYAAGRPVTPSNVELQIDHLLARKRPR